MTIVPAARSPSRCIRRVETIVIIAIIPVGITKTGGMSSEMLLMAAKGAKSAILNRFRINARFPLIGLPSTSIARIPHAHFPTVRPLK
jgi:hypothetical protein